MNEPVITYSREMGLTHSDFWRLLPRAMGDHEYKRIGDEVHAQVNDGTLRIELGPTQERVIALLRIPYSKVTFTFTGVKAAHQVAFKTHFDLHFQRGGG
ncbi:MAG: hypothetical protein KTR32_11120 [Granulosicoccus sp.]|nr:hypothetical protein [Granulosicoccus sp.]